MARPQKVGDTLFLYRRSMLYIPFQQNAYKVPKTKREVRRRTTQNAEKIFDTFTIKQNAEKVSETKKEHWCDVFNFKQNVEKIFDNFTL